MDDAREFPVRLRVLTNSERGALACPRMWWFAYDQGLTTRRSPAALLQGSLVHRGIEAWARSGYRHTIADLEREVICPWVEQRRELSYESDHVDLDEDEGGAERSTGMLRGYLERWADDGERYETIAVEPQIARGIRDREGGWLGTDDGTGAGDLSLWAFGGRVDRVVRDRSTGHAWLLETKTTGARNLDAFCRRLHLDPQTRGYAWALRAPSPKLSSPEVRGGVRVEGVIYDVLRKAVPGVPALLKGGKGLSRARLDTTRAAYRATIDAHGLDPDDYADLLAELPADVSGFFHRVAYTFTDLEIEAVAHEVLADAERAAEESRAWHHARRVSVCQGGGRQGCPRGFESICIEDGPMARRSYRARAIRHEELEGALAEPGAFVQHADHGRREEDEI